MPKRKETHRASKVEDDRSEEEEEEDEEVRTDRKARTKGSVKDDIYDEEEEEEEEEEDAEAIKNQFEIYKDSLSKECIADPVQCAVAIYDDVAESEVKKASALADTEIKKLVVKMTRYLLMHGSKKIPIDRKKLSEVLGEYKKAKITKFILGESQRLLREVWGYDLVPSPKRRNAKDDWTPKWRDSYFLVRRQQSSAYASLLSHNVSKDEKRERAFLMAIFACIMSAHEHKIRDRDLFKYLNFLDPNIPRDPPSGPKRDILVPGLGNLTELIDRALSNGYIINEVNALNDNVFCLGPRAIIDVGRNQILQFQANALGHTAVDAAILKEMQENAKLADDDDENDSAESAAEEEEQQPPTKKKKKTADKDPPSSKKKNATLERPSKSAKKTKA